MATQRGNDGAMTVHARNIRTVRAARQQPVRTQSEKLVAPEANSLETKGGSMAKRGPRPGKPLSEVAKALKRLRLKAGLNRPQMAKQMGYPSPNSYDQWEKRHVDPTFPPHILDKLAAILLKNGITLEELKEIGYHLDLNNSSASDERRQIMDQVKRLEEKLDRIAKLLGDKESN